MSSAVVPDAAWTKEAAHTLSWVTTAALGKPLTVRVKRVIKICSYPLNKKLHPSMLRNRGAIRKFGALISVLMAF